MKSFASRLLKEALHGAVRGAATAAFGTVLEEALKRLPSAQTKPEGEDEKRTR